VFNNKQKKRNVRAECSKSKPRLPGKVPEDQAGSGGVAASARRESLIWNRHRSF
jgi:hypothetical protein